MIGSGSDLFTIKEGLPFIAKKALEHSKVDLKLETQVVKIESDSENFFTVTSKNSQGETENSTFDIVIIAAPLEIAGIDLESLNIKSDYLKMRTFDPCYSVIVSGEINKKYFGTEPTDELPTLILTPEKDDIPFFFLE